MTTHQNLLPGTEVIARGLNWEVVFVQPGGDASLYRLRCLAEGLRGTEIDLVTPYDKIEPIASELNPIRAAQLPHFRVYHDAFLLEQALGPHALLAAQPGRLRIEPYQLVPVLRALAMPRPRLLLADDVGLGKTVEAGLILTEMIARRRAHRILIVCPAGPLLHQWEGEMRQRFGLRFRPLDAAALQKIKYESELGANPFDHVALGIISIDFAKQEKVLTDLERSHFDIVIIDEAHHCTSLGSAGDREDSQRRKLAEVLAERADALLLLTATPHDGVDLHFASLIELLDRSLLDGKGALRGERYRRHVVRRLKRHIKDPVTKEDRFREREVVPERVTFEHCPRYAEFQQAMLALIVPPLRRALKKKAFGDALAFIALLKRSVSSARAAASTIDVVLHRLQEFTKKQSELQEERRQRIRTLRDFVRRRERFGTLSHEEEQDQALLEAEDIAAEIAEAGAEELAERLETLTKERRRAQDKLGQIRDVSDALRTLAALSAEAANEDPKLHTLLAQILTIRHSEPDANILVYTEYSDSQKAVVQHLNAALERGEITGEILSIEGLHSDEEREKVTQAFTKRNNLVLVSTDASAEGLNLHARCHHLIHLELPYNPNRLEQRNGRIDRFGQTHDPVIRYLYLAGTFEERLLFRLVDKYEKQRKRLGFMPNTLGVSATELSGGRLLEGLAEEESSLFANQPALLKPDAPTDDLTSSAYRDMLSELDQVFAKFEHVAKSHDWLGDLGIAADEKTLREAMTAQEQGHRLGAVTLVDFVKDAVRADSAEPRSVDESSDGIITLKLPPSWLFGLDELPGYDPDKRLLRLTQDVDREQDAEGKPLAFLGRAHPIVRRALDRVRHIQFGSEGGLDRRVAVARTDAHEPEILYTFLGQVCSTTGREFERVIAVHLPKNGTPKALIDVSQWTKFLDRDRALPPARVWEHHFKAWAQVNSPQARDAAEKAFALLAKAFVQSHAEALSAERVDLSAWLRLRTREICGELKKADRNLDLFGPKEPELPRWQRLTDDLERLCAFAVDAANTARQRAEANTVIKIHAERRGRIEQREKTETPRILPLGMLLLIPADASAGKGGRHGA